MPQAQEFKVDKATQAPPPNTGAHAPRGKPSHRVQMLLIQNVTDVDQFVEVTDRDDNLIRYTLYAREAQKFTKKIANTFIQERGSYVRLFEETPLDRMFGEPDTWIANMTGSPYEPSEVIVKELAKSGENKGRWVEIKIKNPNADPLILSWDLNPGQTREESDIGPIFRNHPRVKFQIPPGERRYIPRAIATQLLGRDGRQNPAFQKKIVEAPAPEPDEPNDTWPLRKLMVDGQLLDKGQFTVDFYKGVLGDRKVSEVEKYPASRAEATYALLKYIKYRLFDPKYPRPKNSAVEEAFAALPADK